MANLNGGELNGEGLKYPKGVSKLRQIKQRSAHVPDRPKWRRAGTWAGSRGIGRCSKLESWTRGYQVTTLKRGEKMVHSPGPA